MGPKNGDASNYNIFGEFFASRALGMMIFFLSCRPRGNESLCIHVLGSSHSLRTIYKLVEHAVTVAMICKRFLRLLLSLFIDCACMLIENR